MKYDIQERLINFAVAVIKLSDSLPNSFKGNHIKKQIIRCCTASAANYGEGKSAESRQDFIHKLKLALKELRETSVWLSIIIRSGLLKESLHTQRAIRENEELISILFKSVDTARSNLEKSNSCTKRN